MLEITESLFLVVEEMMLAYKQQPDMRQQNGTFKLLRQSFGSDTF